VLLFSVESYLSMFYPSYSMVSRNLTSIVAALMLATGCGGSSTKRNPNDPVTPTPTATAPYSPTPTQIDPTETPIETATPIPVSGTPTATPYQTSTATPIPVSGTPTATPIPTEIDPTPIPSATSVANMAPEAYLLLRPGYEVPQRIMLTLQGRTTDPDNTNPITCKFTLEDMAGNLLYDPAWQSTSDFTYDYSMTNVPRTGLDVTLTMIAKDALGAISTPAIAQYRIVPGMESARPVAIACNDEERNAEGKCELIFYYDEERRIDFGPNGTGSYTTIPGRTIKEARFYDDGFGSQLGEYDVGNDIAVYINYGSSNNGETIVTPGRVEIEDNTGVIDYEVIDIITRSH